LGFKENSLEFLVTLEFDEMWLRISLLHLIARKNIFLAKEDQEFEFQLKGEFGLIL
jgi:meiotically up-regulated gene 157 (Mug157) protein